MYTDEYYIWLTDIVDPDHMYSQLLKKLYDRKFYWQDGYRMDEAVEKNGKDILWDFLDDHPVDNPSYYARGHACSVLEALYSLAKNYGVVYGDDKPTVTAFFWEMLHNAKLDIFDDEHFNSREIDLILNKILHKRYTKKGVGGFFPRKSRNRTDDHPLGLINEMHLYLRETRK